MFMFRIFLLSAPSIYVAVPKPQLRIRLVKRQTLLVGFAVDGVAIIDITMGIEYRGRQAALR